MAENTARITVKDGLEHVQIRPEMYIGSTYDCAHLVTEILDNALDELANKYATTVAININNDSHIVEIMDNGRGIPIHDIDDYEYDSVVASAAKLFSGAKFDDKAYGISIGLHGVGLAVTNALSHWLEITVAHGKLVNTYMFKESVYIGMTQRDRSTKDASTMIRFQPNSKYFNTLGFQEERIRKRLYLISARVPDSTIYLNNEAIPVVSMEELSRYYLNVDESHHISKIDVTNGDENATLYITYDSEKVSIGDINLNICNGTYLTTLTTQFFNVVKSKYPTLTKSNVMAGLKIYCSAFIKGPRFEGQVKNKMVKDITPFIRLFESKMKVLINTPFFRDHFQLVLDSKSNNEASKKLKRTTMVGAGNPLMDCSRKPGDVLYILEGDSAGGTVALFRDNKTEAIFPLSGKILNTVDKNINDALSSKKMRYFLEAIGVDPSGKNKNFRYDRFKILGDADCDGGHIAVLVLLAIYKYAPDIIKNQKLSIILPPLYGTYVNKQFIPIYNDSDLDKYRDQGCEITRFKGLGEMNSDQLETVIRAGQYEYLVEYPKNQETLSAVLACITDTEIKRHLCNNTDKYNIQNIFDAI